MVFTSSPVYTSMPPALQLVYAVLILIAEGSGLRMMIAAPNRESNQKAETPEVVSGGKLRGYTSCSDRLLRARGCLDSI